MVAKANGQERPLQASVTAFIAAQIPAADYLRSNFYLSTSGNARTPQLRNVMAEIDVERILFAVDMPFEKASEISGWFDNCEISEINRQKIGRANALRLFKLKL
jgi:predicted TIM-barrel fold metal-dependent hydrolase